MLLTVKSLRKCFSLLGNWNGCPIAARSLLCSLLSFASISAPAQEVPVAFVTAIDPIRGNTLRLRSADGKEKNALIIPPLLLQTHKLQVKKKPAVTLIYLNGSVETVTNFWKGSSHLE